MSKTVGFILCGLFLITTIIPAQAAEKTPLRQYLETIVYKKELMRVATGYALKERSCPNANPQLVRLRYHVLEQPEFQKALPHPVKGAWFEETRVIVCGGSRAYDVTVFATEDGEMPEFSVAPAKAKKSKP